jgi:predicted dehydrogenase
MTRYNLGVVGLGHWFSWLEKGLGEKGTLNLIKVVGTKPYDQKKELLESFHITRENYYVSEDRLPDEFFNGINVVHISDPNKFHSKQLLESLYNGKYVVVEKTLAVNKNEFEEVSSFIKDNNLNDKVYLHLHYIHKRVTTRFAEMLPGLIESYGKIKSVKATFFEAINEEDPKRTWVLGPENGGIFMDWIHGIEVIFYATSGKFGKLNDTKDFEVNESYDKINPTGVETKIFVNGSNYVENAIATLRMAKGTDKKYANKSIRFWFESGVSLLIQFPDHSEEFSSKDKRGELRIFDEEGNLIRSEVLEGMNTSEVFIKELLDFCNGNHRGLKLDEIAEIFKPQWDYQSSAASRVLIKDKAKVNEFLSEGIKEMY